MHEDVGSSNQGNFQNKTKKIFLFIAIFFVLVILGITFIKIVFPKADTKSSALLSLSSILEEDNIGLAFDVWVEIGEEEYTISFNIDTTAVNEETFIRFTYDGLFLYYADGLVYLEDGTAYRILETEDTEQSEALSPKDYGMVLSLLRTYYEKADITVKEDDASCRIYSISLDDTSSREILTLLYADAAEVVTGVPSIDIDLYTEDGLAQKVFITGGADAAGITLFLEAEIVITSKEDAAYSVPDAVFYSMNSGDAQDAPVLTSALLEFFAAWNGISTQETIGADITAQADFGILDISQEISWIRARVEETDVNCVTLNGHTFYFAGDGADLSGSFKEDETADAKESALGITFLLETAYEIFAEGNMTIEQQEEKTICRVLLAQEEMENIVLTLLPETKELNISYEEGKIEIILEKGEFTSLALLCGGSCEVLFTTISVCLDVQADLMDEDRLLNFELPESVLEALEP